MNCLKSNGPEMSCLRPLGITQKRDGAFTASREYVTVQVLKKLKCAVVCYLQGKIFNPTNLSNYVAPSVELMMQI